MPSDLPHLKNARHAGLRPFARALAVALVRVHIGCKTEIALTPQGFLMILQELPKVGELRRIGEGDAMAVELNPLVGVENIQFSRHAMFSLQERGGSAADIVQGIRSPNANVNIDRKTGHIVFRNGLSRVVVRKENESTATVITVFSNDAGQGRHA